jgi:hypothetical protein
MKTQFRKIRIFVASPGDVQPERDQLVKVINELNLTISAIAPEKNFVLELVRWETHVTPGLGDGPQSVINQQIDHYDIFVGVIWKRLGTPTGAARSGTEEEFNRAYETWQKNKALPVLFYFCQQLFPPPRTKEEVEQLGKVVDFRDELSKKGLVADYPDHESFSDVIRPHLLLVLGKMFSPTDSPVEAAERTAQRAAQADITSVRQEVLELAKEYQHTRATMKASDARTRKMGTIASRMRSLALSSYPLLPELVGSSSAGERLAAVSILELIPDPKYLPWLAERLPVEKPFVGYHAALALLSAVRTLGHSHYEELKVAVKTAKEGLTKGPGLPTDRLAILNEAEKELQHSA